jgi:hypothetical protein
VDVGYQGIVEPTRRSFRSAKPLTKREVKGVNPRIEKFDFKGSVYDRAFLPDELIEPRLSNFAGAVRASIDPAIFTWNSAVKRHPEANGLTVIGWSQHQMQIPAMEPERDLTGR